MTSRSQHELVADKKHCHALDRLICEVTDMAFYAELPEHKVIFRAMIKKLTTAYSRVLERICAEPGEERFLIDSPFAESINRQIARLASAGWDVIRTHDNYVPKNKR